MKLTEADRAILVIASSRLVELSEQLDPDAYDHGTWNIIRELRRMAGAK